MRAMVGRYGKSEGRSSLPQSVARRLSLAYSTSDDPRRKDQRANLQEENVGAYGVLTQLAVWSQLNDLKRAHDELQRVRVEEVSLLEAQCASQEERLVTLTAHYNRQSNEEAEACRDLRIATEKVTNLAGEANKARQDSKSLEEALLLVTGQTSRAAALEVAERQGVDREEYCVKLAELEEEADRLRHALAAKLGLETDLRRLSLRNASLTKELEVATTLVQQLQKAGHDLKAAKLEVERLETRCFSLTTELASEREGSESRLCTILSLKRSLSSLQVASASPRKEVPAGDSVEMSMEVERLGTLVVQLQSAAAEKEAKLVELSSSVSVGEELANRNKQLEVSLQDAQTELRSRSEELACAKATCSQIEEALTRVTGADAEKHTLLAKLTDRSVALCESLVQEKARYERCLAELEEVKSEAERAHVMEIRVEELTSQVQDMEARRETERSLWAQQQADWTRQHALSTHVSDADVQRLRHGCDDLRDRLADAEKRLAEQSAEVRRASQARIVDLENRLEAADTHLAAARCELDKNAELRRRLEAQLAHTEARRLALSGELANASAELRSLVDLAQAAAGHTANEEVVALREMCANLREGAESGWATDSDIAAVRKQLLQKDWAFCEGG
ncbi:MAG: hypothetical protein KVP17_000298 [Porospora cf. gigantea B]|uniref:uncharacterized protein n=1 Tax=Porospora cf. gigantea B TaxID=2853592 RepID=UPI003571BBE8|nr:MAG: hypothetical protein KVP17_000298 [Porospora cf. gigantea B]